MKPLKRSSRPIRRTAVKRSTKPIRKVNPKAKAKRTARYRKMLSGKEYKAARTEAMERAKGQCEQEDVPTMVFSAPFDGRMTRQRCWATEDLHAHHLSYPKSRPLEARDLKIVCKLHHEYLESQKLGKTRMF